MGILDKAVIGRPLGAVSASGGQPAIRSFDTNTGPFDAGTYQTVATYMLENTLEGTGDDSDGLPKEDEKLDATLQWARLESDGSIKTILQECGYSGVPPESSTFRNSFCQHYDPENTVGGSCWPNDPDLCEMRVTIPETPEVHYGFRVFKTGSTPPDFDAPGTTGATEGLARSWTVQVNAAQLAITDCSPPSTDIEAGQTATLSATVENTGNASGSPTVEWTIGGTNLEGDETPETITQSVTVPAGESRTAEATLDVTSALIDQLGGSGTFHVSVVLK